jgi:glycosidase
VTDEAADFFFSSSSLSYGERRLRAALEHGLWHGSEIARRDPVPDESVTLFFASNARLPIDRVAIYYTTDGTEPDGERGAARGTSSLIWAVSGDTTLDGPTGLMVHAWQAEIPGQPDGTLVRYRADGWSAAEPEIQRYADDVEPVSAPPAQGRLFAYSVDQFHPPEWFANAVIYHIFVDRFATGADEPPLRDPGSIQGVFGGTLRGVHEKLDYIQSLGATCIWLSPVFESLSAHGYDPTDYYHVAKRLGTDETLVHLIEAAHERGLRVVLDFVANHTSEQHPLFREARTNPSSDAARFYTFSPAWRHGYATYAHVRTMPELATEHAEVQRYLMGAALDWLGHYGADGLRLDYVPGPPHAFWAAFQRGIKHHYPDAVTIGEITSPLDEIATYAGRMDAYMDFSLTDMLRRVFADRSATLADLLAELQARMPDLPLGMARATLLDNHDMHRFLWLAEGDRARLKLAAVCHLTLDGTPIVYYGTEVGVSQSADASIENAYARAPMLWGADQDTSLLAHYRQLISLRRAHPALRHGKWEPVPVEIEDSADAVTMAQVGGYLRTLADDRILVVLNNSDRAVMARITLGEHISGRLGGVCNVLTPGEGAAPVIADAMVRVELPSLGAVVLDVI